jgi:hypothetical protein
MRRHEVKPHLRQCIISYSPAPDLDRVVTAEKRVGLQNNALMDVKHVDRQGHDAKEGHLARAACLCTLTVSRVPRCHSLPCTCGEKPADKPNWPVKAVTEATRR